MAKAASWTISDAKTRKLGERTGLETPVVLAVNDVDLALAELNLPVPGRGPAQAAERVV